MLVSENYNDYPFMKYQNIGSVFYSFATKHAFVRQTEGQNYDSQDRASIAASLDKNHSTRRLVPR